METGGIDSLDQGVILSEGQVSDWFRLADDVNGILTRQDW
jgi:hypothetical protein